MLVSLILDIITIGLWCHRSHHRIKSEFALDPRDLGYPFYIWVPFVTCWEDRPDSKKDTFVILFRLQISENIVRPSVNTIN